MINILMHVIDFFAIQGTRSLPVHWPLLQRFFFPAKASLEHEAL